MTIKFAVLDFGYVESAGMSSLVLRARDSFSSEEKAKQTLAESLLKMFKHDHNINDDERPCCKENSKKKYCPDCGRRIGEAKFDATDFSDWLFGLRTRTVDDTSGCYYDLENELDWHIGVSAIALIGTKSKEVLHFEERADEAICEILELE